MSEKAKETDESETSQEVFSAVDGVAEKLSTIETFIARRFDEISMEINATSQQIDMNDEEMTKRFGDVMEVLRAVSYSGDGSTAANAGVELGAVVETTEKAANSILDAAERISERIKASQDSDDPNIKQSVLEQITQDIEEIFMACSFQDITGQRIRKTLENLREIEDRLGTALEKIGIDVDVSAENHDDIKSELSSQGDIDDFFQAETSGQKDSDS